MLNIFKRLKDWSDSRGISGQKIPENDWSGINFELKETYVILKDDMGVSGYVLNKLEELIEYTEAMRDSDKNGVIDAIADSMVFDATEFVKKGYDIELTMNEVLMVIESRTGQWDDDLGKFQKDKSPEAKARWYEPDYVNNCKAKPERTESLFRQGGKCKYCGAEYNSLMRLAEHEDECNDN